MLVSAEAMVPHPAAEFSDAERDRLARLLERYRALVARAAAGDVLRNADETIAARLIESLWLLDRCWPRDVAAWREMAGVRSRLASCRATAADAVQSGLAGLVALKAEPSGGRRLFAGNDATLFELRHRQLELEVLHPHLFSGLHVAAYLRWNATRRPK